MKRLFSSFSSWLLLPALALASAATTRAELMLSGSTHGVFSGATGMFDSISNGSSVSTFTTGWPLPSRISFHGNSFASAGDGDTFGLGKFKIKNGLTFGNTAAAEVMMDLFIDLPGHSVDDFLLTTLMFEISHTPNVPGFSPDLYYIGSTTPALLNLGGTFVTFELGFSDPDYTVFPGELIRELHKDEVCLSATVAFSGSQFTPVPEPSTYAAFAAIGLVGLAAVRRFRSRAPAA